MRLFFTCQDGRLSGLGNVESNTIKRESPTLHVGGLPRHSGAFVLIRPRFLFEG
jgi:hypothetical protein